MSVEINTELGTIDVANEVVATIAGGAAVDCYGLVGMAPRKAIKDGFAELLGKDNLSRGVAVREVNGTVEIDLYIIVSYGIRISEVAHNVQSKVKYTLHQTLGIDVDTINVIVQGVRVSE
jgi:uncharacterized alkaline shock family protein YloU